VRLDFLGTGELDFWRALLQIFTSSELVIDRPGGSRHPRFPDIQYPVDYGYLKGTTGGDGQGIDVFAGSSNERAIVGICCTVDAIKRDTEIKILYACSNEEILAVKTLLSGGPMECAILLNPLGRQESLRPDLPPGAIEHSR
jgi:inorganic pyrophosphatase